MNSEVAGSSAVLHNMSCRPSRAISKINADRCVRLVFGPSHIMGPKIAGTAVSCWTRALGLKENPGLDGRRRLTSLVAGHSKLAMLPPVCTVMPGSLAVPTPGYTDDRLLTLAVLLLAPGNLFLRDRLPMFLDEAVMRDVTLLLPPDWRPAI